MTPTAPPEHNVTGQDYADRRHFRYTGPPLIDIHAHVMITRPDDPRDGPPRGQGPGGTLDQAALLLEAAAEFGVARTYSMCPPDDIPPLRARFGDRLGFIAYMSKKAIDEPDETAYRLFERFLELGVEVVKFWAAPRGRDRGLFLDAPWRLEIARRAVAHGLRRFMVHVGDPDAWFRTAYADAARYGTKADQYVPLRRLLETFPEAVWIAAHMGGDPEHPDHLEALLERYPHLYLDTSATKWQVREVSPRAEAVRSLIARHPTRFLFGVDLVTRHHLTREHYRSRYWCQRTLWESDLDIPSPVADPDYSPEVALPGQPATPRLRGLALPCDVLDLVYHGNARRLLGL